MTVVLCCRPREGANLVLSRAPLLEPVARLVGMHDVQSDSVGLLKQVMVMLLLQSASHHRSRMRLYYCLRPRTHRAVRTAEKAGCELRPSPLVEGAVPAPGRSSKGGGALEFELPKTAETACIVRSFLSVRASRAPRFGGSVDRKKIVAISR